MSKRISLDPAEILSKFRVAPSELEAVLSDAPASRLEVEAHPGGGLSRHVPRQ